MALRSSNIKSAFILKGFIPSCTSHRAKIGLSTATNAYPKPFQQIPGDLLVQLKLYVGSCLVSEYPHRKRRKATTSQCKHGLKRCANSELIECLFLLSI